MKWGYILLVLHLFPLASRLSVNQGLLLPKEDLLVRSLFHLLGTNRCYSAQSGTLLLQPWQPVTIMGAGNLRHPHHREARFYGRFPRKDVGKRNDLL